MWYWYYAKLYNEVDKKVHWTNKVHVTMYVMTPLLLLFNKTPFNVLTFLIATLVVANVAYPIVVYYCMWETVLLNRVIQCFMRLFRMKYPNVDSELLMGHETSFKSTDTRVRARADEMTKGVVMTPAEFLCTTIETYAYLQHAIKNLNKTLAMKVGDYNPTEENKWTMIVAVSIHSNINVFSVGHFFKILVMWGCYQVYVYAPQDGNFWDSIDFTEAFGRINFTFAGRAHDIPNNNVDTDENAEEDKRAVLAKMCIDEGLCTYVF
jgi:hypothetical protein